MQIAERGVTAIQQAASTGVIGRRLPMERLLAGMKAAKDALGDTPEHAMAAARVNCASHSGVRRSASTSPDVGVKPASDMLDVTLGCTAMA